MRFATYGIVKPYITCANRPYRLRYICVTLYKHFIQAFIMHFTIQYPPLSGHSTDTSLSDTCMAIYHVYCAAVVTILGKLNRLIRQRQYHIWSKNPLGVAM